MIDKRLITGVILAGGQGSRMGNQDKALLIFQQQPLIAHVIERFEPQVHQLLINANRNFSIYEKYGFPVFEDAPYKNCGPLGGLYTAMKRTTTRYLAIVTCDTPFIPQDLVNRLANQLISNQDFDIVMARAGNQAHYLISLLRPTLAPLLDDFLQNGGTAVKDWYGVLRTGYVDFPDDNNAFVNLNREEDFARYEDRGDYSDV